MRNIMFVIIAVICIISILWVIATIEYSPNTDLKTVNTNLDTTQIEQRFNSMFDNTITFSSSKLDNIHKKSLSEEIVYSSYSNKTEGNNYKIDVNIPIINIDNSTVDKLNKTIKDLFEEKAKSILKECNEETIYTVTYKAYINTNILSLAIKATLKTKDTSQRVIIKTVNYNLTTQKEIDVEELLAIRKIDKNDAQDIIMQRIIDINSEVKILGELGHNIKMRDEKDSKYRIENVTTFLFTDDSSIYILYPYGNNSYTSEVDIVLL